MIYLITLEYCGHKIKVLCTILGGEGVQGGGVGDGAAACAVVGIRWLMFPVAAGECGEAGWWLRNAKMKVEDDGPWMVWPREIIMWFKCVVLPTLEGALQHSPWVSLWWQHMSLECCSALCCPQVTGIFYYNFK